MNIGIVGTGRMGSMLLRSTVKYNSRQDIRLYASNADPEPLNALRSELPSLTACSNEALASLCETVFLCVPPPVYLKVASQLAGHMREDQLLVCISNGVDLAELGKVVPCRIVKMIPNVGNAQGRGVVLVMEGPRCTDMDLVWVEAFMKAISKPQRITPADSRIATNISGCGSAILAQFCESFASASYAHAHKLTKAQLLSMMEETLIATGRLLEAGSRLSEIIDEAATGGGMTEIAVQSIARDLPAPLEQMIAATIARERAVRGQAKQQGTSV